MAQIALIVVNPEAGFTTPMLQQLVDLGYAVHGVADPMRPGEVHSYGWVVDGPKPPAGQSFDPPAAPPPSQPPLTHGNPFDDPAPAREHDLPVSAAAVVPVAVAATITTPPADKPTLQVPPGVVAEYVGKATWSDSMRIKYLLPAEAATVAKLLAYPDDVVNAYKDGAAIGLTRAEFPPALTQKAMVAWGAVANGKRTLPQARTWFAEEMKKQPKPAEPTTQGGLPGVVNDEQALIDLLNQKKYLRQVVSELLERGFTTRETVLAYCESVKEKVPLIKLQGLNLKARLDASFAAIGL